MQLGDLLRKEPGAPCVRHAVEFHVLHQVEGVEHKTKASAVFVPVPDSLQAQARERARTFLQLQDNDPDSPYRWKDADTPGAPIPEAILENEENLVFLSWALRDKDKITRPFCEERDYAIFRRALVPRQVAYLLEEYRKFLDEEYPETLPPKAKEELEEETEGKS